MSRLAACGLRAGLLASVLMGFLLWGPQAASALVGGQLPRSLTPGGLLTMADGTTRQFTTAQAASIRQTLAGQASLYGQTAPPSGSYVLDQAARDKIINASTADAPKTRRGIMKFSERLQLRKPWGMFGAASILATANVAVWSHNAGVVAEHFGWFSDEGSTVTPAGVIASVQVFPRAKGAALMAGIVAPFDGYELIPKTSSGSYVLGAGNNATRRERTGDGSICQNIGLDGVASLQLPYLTSSWRTGTYCNQSPGGPSRDRDEYLFRKADPKPRASAPDGAVTGTSPTAPAAQSTAEFDTSRQAALDGPLSDDEGHALAEAVAGAGLGSSTLTTSLNVPSCTGDLWAACHAKMMDAGLLTNHVVLSFNGADVTKPANAVISTDPAGGATVEAGSTVTVETNPDTAAMPVAVPAPELGETYATYTARLAELGHTGTITRVDLDEATMDPTKGPSAVTGTSPTTGTRIAPDAPIRVRVNPPTAPELDAPGLAMPTIPSIDLSPLSMTTPCNSFPFGVPCWIVGALGGFSGAGNCPEISFPFSNTIFGDHDLELDGCVAEPMVAIIRPVIGIAAMLGLAWLFMGAAMGFGGKGGSDD